jgi:hypothetical protein
VKQNGEQLDYAGMKLKRVAKPTVECQAAMKKLAQFEVLSVK